MKCNTRLDSSYCERRSRGTPLYGPPAAAELIQIIGIKPWFGPKHGNGLQVRHIEKVLHAAKRILKPCRSIFPGHILEAIAANAAKRVQ